MALASFGPPFVEVLMTLDAMSRMDTAGNVQIKTTDSRPDPRLAMRPEDARRRELRTLRRQRNRGA